MAIDKQLSEVHKRYQRRLPVTINKIVKIWKRYECNPVDPGIPKCFHDKVHSLKGASSIFGIPGVSETANELKSTEKTGSIHETG